MAGARDYVSLRNGYKKQNDEKMQLNSSPNSSTNNHLGGHSGGFFSNLAGRIEQKSSALYSGGLINEENTRIMLLISPVHILRTIKGIKRRSMRLHSGLLSRQL
jgi:hypothetical protein